MALIPPQGQQQEQEEDQNQPKILNTAVPKGTGFTNLNRVMQANRSNRLGSTLAGGVAGAAQQFKGGLQGSQQRFLQEANRARLDTPEAAAKRAEVLGRFDDSNVQVDESKFQVSSGLQQKYASQRSTLEEQRQKAQDFLSQNKALIEQRIAQDQAAIDDLRKKYEAAKQNQREVRTPGTNQLLSMVTGAQFKRDLSAREASLASLRGTLGAITGTTAAQEKDIVDRLAAVEKDYGRMTEAEKQAFIQSERDRIVAENLPSAEEMEKFRRYQTGAYTGPKELQDFQALIGQAQETEQLGQLARSTGGREELLKRFVGGREYTQGQRGLDTAILGQDRSNQLSQASKQTLGAERQTNLANRLASAQAQDFVNKARAFGQETTSMIDKAKEPLMGRVSEQLKSMQQSEEQRAKDLTQIQGILRGEGQYSNLDSMSRTGLALQLAADAGYLSNEEARGLLSQGGIVRRAQNLGADINALLAERFQNTAGVGLNEQAAATSDQEARLRALDRLAGRVGTDVAFSGPETYQAGRLGLNFDSLAQEIARQEQAKMQQDAGFAQRMEQQKLTPLQQILGGALTTGSAIQGSTAGDVLTGAALYGGASSALGGLGLGAGGGAGLTASGAMAGAAPYALAAMLASDLLTGGDATAQAVEGATMAGTGVARLGNEGQMKIMDELIKLGGSNDATKNLRRLNEFYGQSIGKGIGEVSQNAMTTAQGLRDLTQSGKIDQAIAKLSGYDNAVRAVRNVGKSVSTALFGGKTGNWATRDYNTTDVETGKRVKIGSFANRSSDEIMRQILGRQVQMSAARGKGGNEGAKMVNELLKYYNAALKREGKA
jgi:hypothetical protein